MPNNSIRKKTLDLGNPNDLVDKSLVDRAEALSLNYNSQPPSQYYQSFGFDELRSSLSEIRSTAIDAGWKETGIDSLSRMRELNRAEDLTNLDPNQLDRKYNYSAGRGGMQRSARDNRPSLEEFGITERPTLLQPDEANTKYGISGHLSWDKPVSSLVAQIQHKRKLEEVRHASTMQRAQGFVDNSIGFGLSMGTAIVDPVGLAIGFIPILGEARYAKLGINAGRFFRGAEAGFVGSLGVEPLIYSAKTQEKADYDMYDSLLNVTFGTVAGGGLFTVGGKMYDGYRNLRSRSHQAALEQAIKQLAAGADVEVGHVATHGAGSTKPILVNTEEMPSAPIGARINPADPNVPARTPTPQDIVQDFPPYVKPADPVVEVEKKKSWLDFFSLKKNSPLDPPVEAIGRAISPSTIGEAFKNPQLSEAIQTAIDNGMPNKVGFYVRTADGQVMLVRPAEKGVANLLTAPEALPSGTVDMNKLSTDMTKLLSEHGLLASENFGVSYKGSYKLDEGGITHILELDGAKFDPEKNQKHTVFGPESVIKNLLSEDPSAQVLSGLNPQGKSAVMSFYQDLGSFINEGDSKFKNFAGYDETKDVTQLKQTGEQLGSNKGGVFKDKVDQTDVYVKFQDANHTLNEWVAATLYRWFQVPLPQTTIVTDKGVTKGVASNWVYGAKAIGPDEFNKLDDTTKQDFIKHFLVDAYLGNWDVVGTGPTWNMMLLPNGQVMRMDPGGALLYRAQGAPKGDQFGAKLDELQSLTNAGKNPSAAAVFQNIPIAAMDDAAYRILRIPQDEINKLIDTAVAHGMDKDAATKLKDTMLKRRYELEVAFKDAAVKAAKEQGQVKFMSTSDAQNYLKGFADELKAKLSPDEAKALMSYTGSYYVQLNNALWAKATKGTPIDPMLQKDIDRINSAFDKIAPLKEDIVVWRGNVHHTTFNSVFQSLGLNIGEFKPQQSTNGDQAYQMLKHAENALIEFSGYTSTSFSYGVTKGFQNAGKAISVQIQVPSGQKALMLGAISTHQGEAEVLLPAGTQLRVKQIIPGVNGAQPTAVLQVVEKGSQQFVEVPDYQALKIAEAYRDKPTGAADNQPLWYEPKDSVADALKGKTEDLDIVNKDIEALTAEIDAHLTNADPALSAAIKKELDATMKTLTEQEASAQDMHKAAQAAAVCVMKGG